MIKILEILKNMSTRWGTLQTFLFGPVMAIGFTDTVSLTGVFLFGTFDTTENDYRDTYKYKTKRRDLDIALNFRLNDYFKLFGGIKYIGIDQTMWGWGHYGVGPAFGLGFTAPMSENLFLLGNISYFYLSGTEWNDDTDEYDTNDYGINATLSLAYYINPITLSLGVRYQYVVTTYDDSDEDITTKFYGITLAATYSFNI